MPRIVPFPRIRVEIKTGWMGEMTNLLTQPLINTVPLGFLTLPGVLAALTRDEVENFPALRAHQGMFWHMFLVQLGALALHRAERVDLPMEEAQWTVLLRGLTAGFAGDEPWCLIVDDWKKPAFMQPPVPEGVKLGNDVPTADALDLLITSKNHDLKQSIGRKGLEEDWVFALVTLQTGEGYGGAGNQGIARMNGGSSSRSMLTLAPRPSANGKQMMPRPGGWFRRDVSMLLETREKALETYTEYPEMRGLGLTWLAPWLEGEQLQIKELDLWFIEVCRRIRLSRRSENLSAVKGTSRETRINAKHLAGALGDPWAPEHKTKNKSFTLGGGDFHYRTLSELLFGGEWIKPLLAHAASFETASEPMVIIAQALARGNSKTEGFKSRALPLSGKVALALGDQRKALHELGKWQAEAISALDGTLSYALKLAAVGGDTEVLKEKQKSESNRQKLGEYVQNARAHFDRYADSIFFEHLWRRFEAKGEVRKAEDTAFLRKLWQRTQEIFEQALPAMPYPSLYRHRAEARARREFYGNRNLRKNYPDLFKREEKNNAV